MTVREFVAKGWKPALLATVLLGFAVASSALAGRGNQGNQRVMPPQSHAFGMTYGEWGDAWWRWAISIPADINPLCDTTGSKATVGQSGDVWFLAGIGCDLVSPVRTVTVPADKALFFPIYNWAYINTPEYGDPEWSPEQETAVRQWIADQMDAASGFVCQIDGVEVLNITSYRCQTPEGGAFMVTFPEGGMWGMPAGTYGPTVADGIFLMLKPLPAGQHTIQWSSPNGEVTYYLTVQ